MKAVFRQIVAELRRRRLQSGLLVVITILASGTATLALTLIAESSNPYDTAFAQQRGAHLTASIDSSKVSQPQAAATTQLIGASAVAGPWPVTVVGVENGTVKDTVPVIGRGDPNGRIDVLHLVAGAWAKQPGEIVISRSVAQSDSLAVGQDLTVISTLAKPHLRIVGEAIDINGGSAWVVPGQVAELVGPGSMLEYKMGYRFATPPTSTQLDNDIARLKAAFPAGSVTDTSSYLNARAAFNQTTSIILVFLVAFGLFALGAVALIVANIVTGAVIARYREIGVLKAVGFTPGQVVQTFVGTMVAPAVAGALIGIVLGGLASQPLLAQSADAMGLPSRPALSPWIAAEALVGVLLLVIAAAALPAWRAGRLHAATAMTLGAAPGNQRGAWLGRALSRLGIPRTLTLGMSDALVRPFRGALTAAAMLTGVATLTFAYGLHGSLGAYQQFAPLHGQVVVNRTPLYPEASLMRTLMAQPETAHIVATSFQSMSVAGVQEPVPGTFYAGDSTRLGWLVLQGRWFAAPGEVVAGKGFLQEAHLQVGDRVTATIGGHHVPIRIVGMTFNPENSGRVVMASRSTLAMALPDAQASTYYVELRPGSDAGAYSRRVLQSEPDYLSVQPADFGSAPLAIFDLVLLALVGVLTLIAVVGVFNTVLLNTRERVHETAILKALGMTPRQIVVMCAISASVLGVVGGLLGVPAGMALHRLLMVFVGDLIGNDLPPVALNVFNPLALPWLVVVGVVLAIIGAALPARWAAGTPAASILHAE
jgi:putative ABC transport system permease protein